MILYLDTSALVKMFADEPGALAVRSAVTAADGCFTHLIAYAETRAAFAKALRVGRETPALLVEHKREFETFWKSLGVLVPDEGVVRRAGDLAEQFGLRGYDSVHLAAAEQVYNAAGRPGAFALAAYDQRLLASAEALGLQVLDHD